MLNDFSIINQALQLGGQVSRVFDIETGEIFNNLIGSDKSRLQNKFKNLTGEGLPEPGGTLTTKGGTGSGKGLPDKGLSLGQNSPFHSEGYLKIYKKGGLIKAGRKKLDKEGENKGGGKREKIFEFSNKSRWRFMQKMGMVEKNLVPIFMTLTYPDEFPEVKEEWSNHIDKLGKRFKRRGWGAIVRKEFEVRKSGKNKGRLVPHFHLLVWGADYKDLRAYIPGAWHKIIKTEDKRHLVAGTRVEELRSWRGVLYYVSKYMAKINKEDLKTQYPGGVGRFWSVINDDGIPWAEIIIKSATDKDVVNLFRAMRRYTRAKKVRSSYRSMTILCRDPEQWEKLIL